LGQEKELLFELGTGLQCDADDYFLDLDLVADGYHAIDRHVHDIARFQGLEGKKQIRFFLNDSIVDFGNDISEL
jgi:hypothetical protein